MRLGLRLIAFSTSWWAAQSVWACPVPTMNWPPNPVCVGCQSVLTLTNATVSGYEVTDATNASNSKQDTTDDDATPTNRYSAAMFAPSVRSIYP